MTLGSTFREIADVLDELEDAGFEIVEPRSRDREGTVAVEFGAIVPALDGIEAREGVDVSVTGASVDGDDRVVLDLAVTTTVDGRTGTGAATDRDAPDEGRRDGRATGQDDAADAESHGRDATADAPDAARDADGGGERPGAGSGGRDEDRPPAHRDPEKLRAVYDAHDTFADMRNALGADVTPQTVRRQMIEHGIHEPGTRGAGSDDGGSADAGSGAGDDVDPADEGGDDAAGEDPDGRRGEGGEEDTGGEEDDHADEENEPTATLADGIDLPDDTGLDELKSAVLNSRTIHEVGRALGTDRERTRRLLAELDLLDLVTGRISAEREVTAAEIDRRVERSAPRSA